MNAAAFKAITGYDLDTIEKAPLKKFVQVADLVQELLKDEEATKKWLMEPNDYFFGNTPLEVCLRGDGQLLVDYLLKKLGR
jgi:uncharacterized protein (DUF2384 family)